MSSEKPQWFIFTPERNDLRGSISRSYNLSFLDRILVILLQFSRPCSGWAAFLLLVASSSERSHPQIFWLPLINSLCSVCAFWFCYPSQTHVRSPNCSSDTCKMFLKLDNKGLMFQMCFVWSVCGAEGLWQEQLTFCFNSLGKYVWEQHSGKLFSCCSQGKTTAIECALGRTVMVLGTAQFCSLLWEWRQMNRLHGEGDSLLPHLLFPQGKKTQTCIFSPFLYWE